MTEKKSFLWKKFQIKINPKLLLLFIEETDHDLEIRDFASQTDSFCFWNDEREDIHQDYLRKKEK
jgi:hypothetical protein